MESEIRLRKPAKSSEVDSKQSSKKSTKQPNAIETFLFRSLFSRITLVLFYSFWFLFGVLVLRKTQNAIAAVRYVKSNSESVSLRLIEESREFSDLIKVLDQKFPRPPAFFLLNQHALNMTDNFLCNTATFPGAHERFIFVTLDTVARDTIKKRWPNIQQFHWPTPSLYKPFSFAEGAYQTIYLLRSNIALALIKKGKSFWMMQQDTFWRKSIFDLNFEDDMSYDAIFDQLGEEDSLRTEWVNGANFFIRANNHTELFFESLSEKLAHWYTPDMGVMIQQCQTWDRPTCAYVPHKFIYSWEWMYTGQKNPPYLMQLDCETDGGSKLMQLGRYGFHFVNSDGTCNNEKIALAKQRMENGTVEVKMSQNLPSWGRLQFKAYWWIVEYMLSTPIIGHYLKPYLAMFFRINGGLSRQYTPTAIGTTWFEVPIKIYPNGKFTSKISDITSLEFRGPYGSLEAEKILKVRRPMLVAAGTGIAPFIRILEYLLEKDDDDLMIMLVYTVRNFEDVLFFEILKKFAKFWNCQIRIYLTKEGDSNNSHPLIKISNGKLGIENFNKLFDEFNPLEVVVCGPTTFEKDICNFCLNRDVQFIRFPP